MYDVADWVMRHLISLTFPPPPPPALTLTSTTDPVTGLGSINFDSFAKIFAVSSPYAVSNDDQYARTHVPPGGGIINTIQSYMTTPNIVLIAIVAAAVLCVPLAYCAYRKRALRQRRQEDIDLAAVQNAQLHAMFPDAHQTQHGTVAVAVPAGTAAAAATPATVAYNPQGPYQSVGLHGHGVVEAQAVPYRYLDPAPDHAHAGAGATANPELVVDHVRAARERDLLSLVDMGFPFAAAESALRASSWDRHRAIALLTEKGK
jgi:hypothetical protein